MDEQHKPTHADLTAHASEEEMRSLLRQARLPLEGIAFATRPSSLHQGVELVANVSCPEGHSLTFSLRELQENVRNTYFNDPCVPYLCPHCAYPATQVAQQKATVFHRLDILKALYRNVRYVSGFDPSGSVMETYHCGQVFRNGMAHPAFDVRYDKLTHNDKKGERRHLCYVCGNEYTRH